MVATITLPWRIARRAGWLALPAWLARAYARARAERSRREVAYHMLHELDAYTLRDIGVSHAAMLESGLSPRD